MTYDLWRLRLHGLIQREPHTFRYTVTCEGLGLAFGVSRIHVRLLRPDWAALHLPTPELPEPCVLLCTSSIAPCTNSLPMLPIQSQLPPNLTRRFTAALFGA